MYVYFYSLHVSGSHVPIIRRIIVSMLHPVYVTLCRWPSGLQEHMLLIFYVLLTMHPGMILVNNQPDAQFFMYVYLYSLHVSGSHMFIIRRIIVSMLHPIYVTLCRWPSGMQEHMLLQKTPFNEIAYPALAVMAADRKLYAFRCMQSYKLFFKSKPSTRP